MVVTAKKNKEITPSKVTLDAKSFSGKYTDLQSVLETVSGVVICNSGGFGHYADASIRGSSTNQVQVYLDGIPLNGGSGNAVDLSKIPLASLQSITINKSIPSIEYFGDNAGGIITLSTDSKNDATTASIELGSFGYKSGTAMICKTVGSMAHRLSVNYGWSDNNFHYTDSIITHGPTVANDDSVKGMDNNYFSEFSSVYSNTYAIDDKNKLTSQIFISSSNEGIFYLPEAGNNDGSVRNTVLSLIESYKFCYSPKLSLAVIAKGKTEDQQFRRIRPFYLSIGPIAKDISQPFASLETIVKSYATAYCTLSGTAGISYTGFTLNNLLVSSDQLSPHYRRIIPKAGLEASFKTQNSLDARLGAVYRYEIDSTNDSITLFGSIVPFGRTSKQGFGGAFADLNYRLFDSLELSGQLRYSGRSPGFSEKYSQGSHVSGNPDLRPEYRLEYSLGLSFSNPVCLISTAVFASTTKDKILFLGHSNMFIPKNVSKVEGWGVENDITVSPFSWISVVNSVSYMINTLNSDEIPMWNGNDEPLLPRLIDNLNAKITYKNFYLSHSAKFQSGYFTDPTNLDYIESRPQLGATIGFFFGGNFDLSYRIENYLNVRDYDFQRPLPGIAHYVVLKYSL